ncbi:MAG: Dabb family protein [Lentisphaerae bacterium]|nr:Dabb family protein [Lentisphaerota bacterium]
MKRREILAGAMGAAVAGAAGTVRAADPAPAKRLRHVVLFKFKDGAAEADIRAVENAFRGLAVKIDLIREFEWGTNNSPEGLSQGFTHCFFVTFATAEARDAYLPHPDHKAFVDVLKPVLDKVLVVDYWAKP